MTFWDFFWTFFWFYVMISYLMILFSLIGDVFRDETLGGLAKAVWTLFLVFIPFLTALVYVVSRGRAMSEREAMREQRGKHAATSSPTTSPVQDIDKAKQLLDAGTISQPEFESLKSSAIRSTEVSHV